MGGPHTLKNLKTFDSQPRFQDFREMFDRMADQIDAVTVARPTSLTFPSPCSPCPWASMSMSKALTRTFHESELLMKAASRYGVATQMGNQGHCQDNYYQFKTWVEKGVISGVEEITAHMNGGRRWHGWNTRMADFPKSSAHPRNPRLGYLAHGGSTARLSSQLCSRPMEVLV